MNRFNAEAGLFQIIVYLTSIKFIFIFCSSDLLRSKCVACINTFKSHMNVYFIFHIHIHCSNDNQKKMQIRVLVSFEFSLIWCRVSKKLKKKTE